ncbi:hypothetical protein [Nocardioides sambongensis]|uniref:hypothetical protein n=1 Tax=Nocardioides sambongensis TaxID=2589074 RepID=UPI001128642A|nr:hypothetical protein [Nocardioides sambongensis]
MSTDPDGADLRDLIDHAIGDLEAPVDLPRGVISRGRVARRRRRALTVGGGVATLAVGAALVVPLAAGGGGDVDSAVASDPAPGTPSPSAASQTPSPAGPSDDTEGDTYTPPPGWWDAPSTDLLAVLEDLLPAGVAVRSADTEMEGVDGGPVDGAGFVRAVLDGRSGPGAFEVLLYPPETASAGPDAGGEPTYRWRTTCPGNLTAYDACEVLRDEDGGRFGRLSTATPGDITIHEVTLLGPDGGLLYGAVTNSTDEKWGRTSTPSGAQPPLQVKQLRTLVEDDAWTSYQP